MIDDDRPWDWRDNSAYTAAEVRAVDQVLTDLKAASADTPRMMQPEEFITTG